MRGMGNLLVWMAMLPAAGAAAEPLSAAAWRRHPAAAEIQAIYQAARQAEATGRLRQEQRTFESCQAYDDADRTLLTDAAGNISSYRTSRGSEDSLVRSSYYYDRYGALRFVLVRAGAVNGTTYEYRVYLSRSGERLWEDRRRVKGPGYTFPDRLPDDWLVRDPKRAFDAPAPCVGGQ